MSTQEIEPLDQTDSLQISNKDLITRRQFLFKKGPEASLRLFGAGYLFGKIAEVAVPVINEQINDQHSASLDNKDFYGLNKEKLSNTSLGCSFSPEEFGVSLATLEEDKKRGKLQTALDGLDFAVQYLGIKQIRLGIRWNNAVDDKGNFAFDLYKPFFDYCVENGIDICLNTGIKVFRWPEDHVPKAILKEKDVPPRKTVVSPKVRLARQSIAHATDLFEYLHKNYDEEQLSRIITMQLENEPFDEGGGNQWTMGQGYLRSLVDLSLKYFPNSSILINTANPLNLETISNVFTSVIQEHPDRKGKLISGYDYYPLHPDFPVLPGIGRVDSITASKIFFGDRFEKHKEDAKKIGFRRQVTEGQVEPWGALTEPGNSIKAFRFMVQRSLSRVLTPEDKYIIKIWGVEYLYKRLVDERITPEHEKIFELTQMVNGKDILSLSEWASSRKAKGIRQ